MLILGHAGITLGAAMLLSGALCSSYSVCETAKKAEESPVPFKFHLFRTALRAVAQGGLLHW